MRNVKFFDRLLIICVVFFVMFVVTAIVLTKASRWFPGDERTVLLATAALQSVLCFIVPSFIGAKLAFGNPVKFLRIDVAPTGMSILGVVIAYLISLPFMNQLIYWNMNIVFPESLEYIGNMFKEMEDQATQLTDVMLQTESFWGMIVGLLIIGVLTGFSEELFFRGTLQQAGASRGAVHTSIWVTALIFSAFHFQIFGFVPRFLLGAWFGYLLYWTGSIYVPFIAHALNNGVVVVCAWIFTEENDFKPDLIGVTESGFPLAAFISALAMAVFIIYFKDFFFSRSESYNYNGQSELQ